MTRKDISVLILSSLVSTADGMQAIGQSAQTAGEDPFVYAAKSAIQFSDALLNELSTEKKLSTRKNLKVYRNTSVKAATSILDITAATGECVGEFTATPKHKRAYKRKAKNES